MFTGNVDYVSGPYTITFLPRVTYVILDVPIINDDIVETNESFILTIDPSSLPSNVVVGDPYEATVTILNDDSK